MRRHGFTLVEVVASLVMATVTLVSILNLLTMNAQGSHHNKERVIAYNLLQRKAEEIKALGFGIDASTLGSTFTLPPGFSYTITQTLDPFATGNVFLKRIDVDVIKGGRIMASMATLMAQY